MKEARGTGEGTRRERREVAAQPGGPPYLGRPTRCRWRRAGPGQVARAFAARIPVPVRSGPLSPADLSSSSTEACRGEPHTDAPAADSPSGRTPNPCTTKQSGGIATSKRHAPLSPRAGAKGGGEAALRRSLQVPLSLRLLTGGSVSRGSAPTWEVRGRRKAAASPRPPPPATGAGVAPPRAEPGLLSRSPRQRRTHTGAGGRSGGGKETWEEREQREGAPVSSLSALTPRGEDPAAAAGWPRRVTSQRAAPGGEVALAEEAWRAQSNSAGGEAAAGARPAAFWKRGEEGDARPAREVEAVRGCARGSRGGGDLRGEAAAESGSAPAPRCAGPGLRERRGAPRAAWLCPAELSRACQLLHGASKA